jgi:hypothetical protein
MGIINFGLNTVDVDSSQLIDLINNPVVILDGQKDSILVPHRVVCSYFLGTMTYVSSSSNLTIAISDLIFGQLDSTILSSEVNSSCLINISDCHNVITNTLINQPLLLKNSGQNLSNGNGTLKIFVWYSTIAF